MITKDVQFQTFVDKVETAVTDFYGINYQIHIQEIRKTNNVILTGLTIMEHNHNVAPTIYLESFYESYQSGTEFGEIIKQIVKIYENNKINHTLDVDFFNDYDSVRKKLCFKLIHYDLNRELLKEVPHIRYLDLAIVFHCAVMNDYIGNGSILIHNNHMNNWNVTTKQLLEDAKQNMPRMFPPDMKNMTEIMMEMYRPVKNEESVFDSGHHCEVTLAGTIVQLQIEQLAESNIQMYVLSNKSGINGAAVLVYENLLKDLAALFEHDLYILPSSVHEVIIIPKHEDIDEIFLSQMVNDVNETKLQAEEILSDHAYLYLKEENQVISLPLIKE